MFNNHPIEIISTLDQILLDKVAYETQISVKALRAEPKFMEYWLEFCQTTEQGWTLNDVIEFALEMGYNGYFGDNLWLDPCPNHKGGFDCSPFCPICEGNQYA